MKQRFEVFSQLRDALAALYLDLEQGKRVAYDAGLDRTRIEFSGRSIDNWANILEEAEIEDKVLAVLDGAESEFPGKESLRQARADYESWIEAGRLGNEANEPAESRSFFTVPFMKNPSFVGRDADLERLHQTLTGGDPVWITSAVPVPTGLIGMGGIGKTQLAVEYAYRQRAAYPGGVFWINAAEPLLHGFAEQGLVMQPRLRDASMQEQALAFAERLRQQPAALVVLDNLADPAQLTLPIVPSLIPADLSCRLLFTTRQRELGRFVSIYVDILAEEDALDLLLRDSSRQAVRAPRHPEHGDAQVIARMLGYLPLALEIAGAHLGRRPDASLAAYRHELEQRSPLLVLDDPRGRLRAEDLPTRHEDAVAATLASQWATVDSAEARLLLQVAGQLPEAALIPQARLGLLAGVSNEGGGFFGSPLSLALEEMKNASLVERLEEEQVRLHPLVREFAVSTMGADEVVGFRWQCAANLAAAYRDFNLLERQCGLRGVHALEEDLLTALQLLEGVTAKAGEVISLSQELRDLLLCLQREAHVLVDWKPLEAPALFAQQVCKRAVSLGGWELGQRALTRLDGMDVPFLRPLWQSTRESMALERTLQGHSDTVCAVAAVGANNRRVLSASADGSLKIWDLASGIEEITFRGHSGSVNAVAVTPDGCRAVSACDDRTIRVWNLDSGREDRTLPGHRHVVNGVAVTSDGNMAVSGCADGTIVVWNLANGRIERVIQGHRASVRSVALTPGDQRIISASSDHSVKVWDLVSGSMERDLHGHSSRVHAVAVTPDGQRIVSASGDHTIRIWNLASGREEKTLRGHTGRIRAVAVTPDSTQIVTASSDGSLKLWNLAEGREERSFVGHGGGVRAVAITPDGQRVISGSFDKLVKVWNLAESRKGPAPQGHKRAVSALAVTPDGRRIISGSYDRTLRIWNLLDGTEERMLEGHSDWIRSIAVTADGQTAISASDDRTLKVWDLAGGRERYTLHGHEHVIRAVAATPDGTRIISGSSDRTLIIWDLVTGHRRCTLKGHRHFVRGVAITPDGRQAISVSSDRTMKIWDLVSGTEVRTLRGHGGRVNAVAVAPEGQSAVSASSDCTLMLWNLASDQSEPKLILRGHRSAVLAVMVSSDGRLAVSCSDDRTLKVWDLTSGTELASIALDNVVFSLVLAANAFQWEGETKPNPVVIAGDSAGSIYALEYVEPVWQIPFDD